MKLWAWFIVALLVAFFAGWVSGSRCTAPEIVETVRVDTLFFERPQPVSTSDIEISVAVPRLLFAPADTVDRLILVGDSVAMTIAERTLEYCDSSYFARVVGPVVGDLGPRLDFIETYSTNTTRTSVSRISSRWTAGPAVWIYAAGEKASVWAGAFARRDFGPLNISASAGYDFQGQGLFGQVRAEIAVFKSKK